MTALRFYLPLLYIQGTQTGPLVRPSPGFPSHAMSHGTLLPRAHPEDGWQIPTESPALVRTGPSHVTPKIMGEEPGGKCSHGGTESIPPAGVRASAAVVEDEGLPASPRFFMRSQLLHMATSLLKPARAWPWLPHQCALLLLQQCGRATSSRFWWVLSFSYTCCTDGVSPTYVASHAAFTAAATSLLRPVWTPAAVCLPVLLPGSLRQLNTPKPAAGCSSRAAVHTSGLAGRQQLEIRPERS